MKHHFQDSVMDEDSLYLLLITIKNNGSANRLIESGLSYIDIAKLTNYAISKEMLINTEKRIVLTKKGEKHLLLIRQKLRLSSKNLWIEEEKSSKISKIDKNDVFLPRQDDLWFS